MRARFLDTGFHTPAMNMAIDEALLSSPLPVLRFYRWKPGGLSLGTFQHITGIINTEYCEEEGIPIVRRVTGGNAVLHDKELTYSLVIGEKEMPASIQESYRKISMGLLKGLELLGVRAEMNAAVEEGEKSAVCFFDPSWYELLSSGKKLVGSAQKRTKGKLLQHGAVLLEDDTERYARCFSAFSPSFLEKLRSRMTSVSQEAGRKIAYQELAEALREGFSGALGLELEDSALTEQEQEDASRLAREKYADPDWHRASSPSSHRKA